MKNVEIKVGNRVVCIKAPYGIRFDLVGKHGTTVKVNSSTIGVDFDDLHLDGHTCEGTCKAGYGWFGEAGEFELEGGKKGMAPSESDQKIEVGDTVEVTKDQANGSYWMKGERFTILRVESYGYIGLNESRGNENWVGKEFLRLITNKGGEEGMLKKVIVDNFKKTDDAVIVEKHLGNQITDNFMCGLVVAANKDAILAEAKKLEAEENDKKDKGNA